MTKAGLTLNDLYDIICLHFHTSCSCLVYKSCSYRIFSIKSLSKMSQDQAAEAVITALLTKENKSRKKRQKRNIGIKPWLKRRKSLEFYDYWQICGYKMNMIIKTICE